MQRRRTKVRLTIIDFINWVQSWKLASEGRWVEPRSQKILVVDDDELVRDVLVATLVDFGLEAVAAPDGPSALAQLEQQQVDLVLSDVRMPGMDGIALTQTIRSKYPTIPVLLVTGAADVHLSIKATEAGASGLMSKPFQPDILIDQIREILETFQGTEQTRDEDFARVSIGDFVSGKMLPFHIYVRVGKDRFIRIANKGVDLDLFRVRAYQERGVQFLHLRKHDFKTYFKSNISLMQRIKSERRIAPEKKKRFLKHAGELIVAHSQFIGLDEDAVAGAREYLMSSLEVAAEDEGFVDLLTLFNSHADFVYAHSLAVSLVCTLLARELDWDSPATTFKLGMAGLLHDIGKKEIDRAILAKPRHLLSPEERATIETHPHRGYKIAQAMATMPDEVLQAILQHHEEPSGLGYPAKTRGLGICPMAQIVSLANIFCNYTVRNPSLPKEMTEKEAILQIEKFDVKRITPLYLKALKSLCKP